MTKVSTSAPTRTERRKARTEAAILAAAEKLFHERGFRDTRIEDLAAAADVAVGTIYAHFGSKLGLFLQVVDDALHAQEQRFARIHGEPGPADEKLRALGDAFVTFAIQHPSKFRLLSEGPLTPAAPSDGPVASRIDQLAGRGQALIDALAATVQKGITDGILRPVDPQLTARFLWAAWSGTLSLHLRHDRLGATDPDELRSIVDQGVDVVTNGLLNGPSTAR